MWGNQHFLLLMDRSGTKLAGNIEIFMVVDILSESARSRSFSVHPQLWMPGGRKLDVEGLVMIGLYCAGLDDRYPIMSYTHGNLWTQRSRCMVHPIFCFSAFREKCISRISFWKTSRRSAKIEPNAYPDINGSGRTLLQHFTIESGSVGPKNVRNWLRRDKIHLF